MTSITLTLTLEETDLVLAGLTELRWRVSNPLIIKIQSQAGPQVLPMPDRAVEGPQVPDTSHLEPHVENGMG